MSIGKVDLNLLKVFDAVFEERNLVLAGRRLHLSQSAVSHALSRLREVVGDELFVRTGRGMVPTGGALRMAPALRDALRRIEATLDVAPFSARGSQRQFVIAANDHVTAVLVAPLARKLQRAAPGVDLVIRPSTRLDLAEQIDLGRIDLAIGIFSQVPPRMSARTLMSQGEAILMRKDHPASRGRLTLTALRATRWSPSRWVGRRKARWMASFWSAGWRASRRCSTAARCARRWTRRECSPACA